MATLHDKLDLIAPPMFTTLGLEVFSTPINTDAFGTFAGEIPRPAGQYATAIMKARAGMSISDSRIGFASEGSIVSDGVLPVISDTEIVVVVDELEGFEVGEHAVSYDIVVHRWNVTNDFPDETDLQRAGFPHHGLTVRTLGENGLVFKGIHDHADLAAAISACRQSGADAVVLESDLRANHSPSRRPTIRRAAERLAERLTHQCPACACPGWGPVDVLRGQKCGMCHQPTNGRLASVFGCCRCDFRETGPITVETADPSICETCNP